MAGFFTGFVTGFANGAVDITKENERQRNQVIERSMQAFRSNIERRQERDREMNQQLAQARVFASRVGGEGNAEAIVRSGLGPQLMAGQISVTGAPNAAPTPAPITGQGGLMAPPSNAPTAPTAPGLGQPSQAPTAPSDNPMQAPSQADPRDAIGAAPQAPQEAPQERGVMDTIRQGMFGRRPFEGVGDEVRNRYMQESGMQRSEMERLMSPERPIPQIQGQVNVAPMAPADMARLSTNFRDAEGMQRFIATNGQDTSGLVNYGDQAALQREIAALRGAGRGSTPRPININPSYFNAAERSLAGLLPSGMIRTSQGPDGQTTFTIAIPSNDPRYANAQRMLATAREALGPALRGEVDGVHIGDTSAAAAHAARVAGFLGNQPTQPQGTPNPAQAPTRATPNADPTPSVTPPRESTSRPPNVPQTVPMNGQTWTFSRMRGNTPVYTNGRQEIDGVVR